MSVKPCRWMAMITAAIILFGLSDLLAAEENHMAALQLLKIDENTEAPDFQLPAVIINRSKSAKIDKELQGETNEVNTATDETGETQVTGSWDKIMKWATQRWGSDESAKEREGLEKISLSDYRGSVVFLNFWATWCPPCLEEMPDMEKLYQRLKGTNFAILAISIDVSGSKAVRPYMKEKKLTFPALLDPDREVTRKYGVVSMPTTFLINCQGSIVAKAIGAREWNSESALELIKSLQTEPQCKG